MVVDKNLIFQLFHDHRRTPGVLTNFQSRPTRSLLYSPVHLQKCVAPDLNSKPIAAPRLARRLCNNKDLVFVEEFAKPPVITIDQEQINRINEEAKNAENVPIDDDDDDDL